MIIFLYGPDTYRSREKLNEIIASYQKTHKSGLNLKYFDCNNPEIENLKDEFQTTSMFKEKKLIVLNNVFSNLEKEEILNIIKKNKDSEDIILIYEESKINKGSSLYKFLKKYSKSQEFDLLEGEKLKNWLKKEFLRYKKEISSEVIDKLISFVGNDLWQLSNEVKKLVNYKPKDKIESKDVELLVRPKIETDIFKTIDAIAQKNKKRAIILIHKHLEKGDNPLYLLSMINFQFRNLLIIKDLMEKRKPYPVILKISKLHPFVVKKTWQLANQFTLLELKKIYQRIFQVDISIKTGKLKPETALDLLITEL